MAMMQKRGSVAPAVREVGALLEISSGTRERYRVDPKSRSKELRGSLQTQLPKDLHYGFLPFTEADDGDELDVIVVSSRNVSPGDEIRARPIGILVSKDERATDDKIIAIDVLDPAYSHICDVQELPHGMRGTIWHFIDLAKKESAPDGYVRRESFGGPEAADRKIDEAKRAWLFAIERRDTIHMKVA